MVNVDDYKLEKSCIYKNERYKVRDNGAVLRYPQNTNQIRPLDNKWTFGKTGNHGYLYIAGVPVHRIVATAFHGVNNSKDYIVDHIDTNKQNNRPENLRWITKEDNILKNQTTIDKLEFVTGYPIEELKKNNWEKLHNYSSENQNTEWMRPTTEEEAENLHKRQNQWHKNLQEWNPENKELYDKLLKITANTSSENEKIGMGEYVFNNPVSYENYILQNYMPSDTKHAVQTFMTRTIFPCCPNTISTQPLMDYYKNLKKDEIFSVNKYYATAVVNADITEQKDEIVVKVYSVNEENEEYYTLFTIKFDYGYFIHSYEIKFDINDEDTCDICYDFELGKIPFDENNPILWSYEYDRSHLYSLSQD